MDALISQYEGKRFFQAPRPVNTVQCIYAGQSITAWQGPYQGVGTIDGSDWRAYQSMNVVHPPNPDYPCGHCIGSSAATNAINEFYQNNTFVGWPRTYNAGQSQLEPKIDSGPRWIPGVTDVPNTGPASIGYSPAAQITVSGGWPSYTWNQLGFEIGESRVWLGIHFNESNVRSHEWGNQIAIRAVQAARFLFDSKRRPTVITDIPVLLVTASGKTYPSSHYFNAVADNMCI